MFSFFVTPDSLTTISPLFLAIFCNEQVHQIIISSSPILAFLTRKSAALLENEELQKLLDLLEDNLSPPVEDRMINFEDYLKVESLFMI